MQGNFAWTAQTGAFLVYVEALFLMVQDRSSSGRFNPFLLAIFSVHVLCGIIYAVANAAFPAPLWL